MEFIRRYRISALFCAIAVLVCERISSPFAEMGIGDDWSYSLTTWKYAATGHIVYNGWGAPILGWQVFWGALFVKLFGQSYTSVRLSDIVVAMGMAFLLQRILVRCGISERNATLGTLALVLSPLYLILSATFMTDIPGLFAMVVCLYGCLRALQAERSSSAIGWLFFAALANALLGTTRQIAWLGLLVMVPSALWLLRSRQRVLIAGIIALLAGIVVIAGILHWFSLQPYSVPEKIPLAHQGIPTVVREFAILLLDMPFLLLPVFVVFLPGLRRTSARVKAVVWSVTVAYVLFAVFIPCYTSAHQWLEPMQGDWVNAMGTVGARVFLDTASPTLFPSLPIQIVLTVFAIGGLIGLIALLANPARSPEAAETLSWHQIRILLLPFSLGYLLLLLPRAQNLLFDRYSLSFLVVALIFLLRFYQERVQLSLPAITLVAVAAMAVYGVVLTHNVFAFYRARIAVAAELTAAHVAETSLDGGWEYDAMAELHNAPSLNDPHIHHPANLHVEVPPVPAGTCAPWSYPLTPHVHPVYGISFHPDACLGEAPFAPVTYSRWLGSSVTLYVVRYKPYPVR